MNAGKFPEKKMLICPEIALSTRIKIYFLHKVKMFFAQDQ